MAAGNRLGRGCSFPDAPTAGIRAEGATLTHNRKAEALASNQGQPDQTGVSRQMRRLFGPLGGGGHKDALATMQEKPAPRGV